jgi:hypothetical protein
MTTNPNASSDTLSESQTRLLKSVQQLQDEQKNTISAFATASDPAEKKRILDKMKQNETLQTTLLSSLGRVALVQTQEVENRRNAKMELTTLVELAEQELEDVRARVKAAEDSRSAKKRMIELNSYYGKRFMAQAGVMKIFIYMCIPVLVLAVLANMGLLPQYIAGFIIIAVIVTGIVYMYYAVNDINRRDKVNFDEYTWEFDPSRVGDVINPTHNARHHGRRRRTGADAGAGAGSGSGASCVGSNCCDGNTTKWNETSGTCVIQDAQGGGSAVKGETMQTDAGLLGDLSSPSAVPTTGPSAAPTTGPTTAPLCWTDANRKLKGQCMGGWTYDAAADTCTAPAGSAAASMKVCSPYKVSVMNDVTPFVWNSYMKSCVGPYLKEGDLSNCT